MKSESIAYVIAGICFGIILGWVIGTQQARRSGPAPAPVAATQPSGTVHQQGWPGGAMAQPLGSGKHPGFRDLRTKT